MTLKLVGRMESYSCMSSWDLPGPTNGPMMAFSSFYICSLCPLVWGISFVFHLTKSACHQMANQAKNVLITYCLIEFSSPPEASPCTKWQKEKPLECNSIMQVCNTWWSLVNTSYRLKKIVLNLCVLQNVWCGYKQ
jgi:hypothetical protein